MRISDWSSDVCSSDLAGDERFGGRVGEGQIGEASAVVEAVDRAACDAGQIGDGYHGRALLIGEDNGNVGEKPARYAGSTSVELAGIQYDAGPGGQGIGARRERHRADGLAACKPGEPARLLRIAAVKFDRLQIGRAHV